MTSAATPRMDSRTAAVPAPRRTRVLKYLVTALLGATLVASVPFGRRVQTLMTLSNKDRQSFSGGFYYYNWPEYAEPAALKAATNPDGIFVVDYGPGIGEQAAPVGVAQFVLKLVGRRDDRLVRDLIVRNLDFLVAQAEVTPQGNLVFPYRFDWPIAEQKKPWCSGMAQGVAASALLWGHRITGEARYLIDAKRAILAMLEEQYGTMTLLERGCWLNEFPGYSATVLDGALAAIAGVYDLQRSLASDDPDREAIERLLADSIVGFKANWRVFDSESGHWFDDQLTLISPGYHGGNLGWLTYLSGHDPELLEIRRHYEASHGFVACVSDTARYSVHRIVRALGLKRMSPRIH